MILKIALILLGLNNIVEVVIASPNGDQSASSNSKYYKIVFGFIEMAVINNISVFTVVNQYLCNNVASDNLEENLLEIKRLGEQAIVYRKDYISLKADMLINLYDLIVLSDSADKLCYSGGYDAFQKVDKESYHNKVIAYKTLIGLKEKGYACAKVASALM